MKKLILLSFLFIRSINSFSQSDVVLITQFINPCGGDGGNEFIIGLTINSVNVGNLGFASINHTSTGVQQDFNWYWYGKNIATAPNPTFTTNSEVCGVAGSGLSCFRLMDPGTPADATVIDNARNNLNSIAGCNVFLPVPATGVIPPGSLFVVFLGAGGCGFDIPATNLNFSNHCSGGTPIQQYYFVAGTGAYTPLSGCGGGYFVNANGNSRTSTIYNFTGGANNVAANYQTRSVVYTNGAAPAGGNAGIILPNGAGGSYWLNNASCVPSPGIILDEESFDITSYKIQAGKVTLDWKIESSREYDYFVLEKSNNGINFSEVKTIKPVNNFHSVISGTADDNMGTDQAFFYRIRAASILGKTTFSHIKFINNHGYQKAAIYPNPAKNYFTIQSPYEEKIIVSAYDITGVQVHTQKTSTGNTVIDISRWPSGFYSLKITDLSGRLLEVQKFIRM
jgi:hypothetical protein